MEHDTIKGINLLSVQHGEDYTIQLIVAESEQHQPQERPLASNKASEDLKQEQTAAPSVHTEDHKESALSPNTHNDTPTDTQISPQRELLPAPVVDLTLPAADLEFNADIATSLSGLPSAALPTAGSFNPGTNTALIDPSQPLHSDPNTHTNINLDSPFGLLPSVDFLATSHMDLYEPPMQPAAPATGFAKLEFLDGHFYMTTYAVELGRDMRAFRVAQTQTARQQILEENMAKPRKKRSASVPGTPARQSKGDGGTSVARSFLSESGGIIGDDDGHIILNSNRKRRKKSQKSKSTETSSSQSHLSRKNSTTHLHNEYGFANQNPLLTTVDPNATAPLDPMVHMPDPHFTPLIPIHPPKSEDEPLPTGKGISRKHVRIAYNFDKGHFEMSVQGRNGAFHDEDHYEMGDVVALHDGSQIQIGGVYIKFVLPNVAMSDEEVDEDLGSISGRMSFCFEDSRGASIVADDESVAESAQSEEDDPFTHTYYDENNWDVDDMDDDEDDNDEADYESPKAFRQKLKIRALPPKAQKKPSGISKPIKTATKLKLKITSKQKARAEAEAREREAQCEREERREARRALKAKKQAKKAKLEARAAKEAAKEAKAQQAKEAMKQPASKQPAKQPAKEVKDVTEPPEDTGIEVKQAGKEPSKTPNLDENKPPKEPAAPRISRDAPMQNGDEVTVAGLPAGVIIPARKKGPGRPPKDGVMSKRERALLIKQAKEREKAIKLGLDPSQIPPPEMKPPKSRPRKNSQGEDIDGDEVDGDDKKPKTPRPPRSPSPEMRIEDYTEEQLQRPQPNYVYLIYEAIQNCKSGVMNLQQIYSAIERRYPYFKFKTTSNGWQSSVRHNLGQHEAFRKVEKEGKGWLWGIKQGVPIERERKKKTPPPQAPPNGYNQGYPQYPQYPQYAPHPAPQPQSGAPSHAPAPGPGYQQPQRISSANMVPPTLHQQAVKPPPSLAQAPGALQSQSYSSPYAKDNNKSEAPKGPQQSQLPSSGPPYQTHPPPGPYSGPSGLSGPSSYQNNYRPHPHVFPTIPPVPSGQPHTSIPRPRYRLPAQDVIDTFKKVFVATYSSKDNFGPARAEAIVSNAIKRVLEPDAMTNVPQDPDEEGVCKAFEGILVQSQGPPRQATAGPPPAITISPQNQAQISRSAEANLMGMLMRAPGKGSPTPTNVTAPTNSLITAANAIAHNQNNAVRVPASLTASVPPPTNAPWITAPDNTPYTVPLANATNSLALAPAPPMMSTPGLNPSPLATAPVPTANMGQLSQKSNGIAETGANGTTAPSRPAVEPLTPPPGAAPILNAPSVSQTGMKRGPSPQVEVPEVKKARVESASAN